MFGLLKMPKMAELKNKEYTGFTNSAVDIGKLRIDSLLLFFLLHSVVDYQFIMH